MKTNEKVMDGADGMIHLTEAPWLTWCGQLTVTVAGRWMLAKEAADVDCAECLRIKENTRLGRRG